MVLPSSIHPSSLNQGIAIVVFAVHAGHQRVMPDCVAAPLVGILQPGFQEVQTRSEACQDQDRHQQVEGNKPVQEEPRHTCCRAGGGGEGVGKEGGWSEKEAWARYTLVSNVESTLTAA